ncbi:unnamed protein product, partial [Tuber aestivum]
FSLRSWLHGQRNELLELTRPPSPLVGRPFRRLGLARSHKGVSRIQDQAQISPATEVLSKWLAQFENPGTNVTFLGHSYGDSGGGSGGGFRHRILGVVGFDSPFLGKHPGVISAGLGSLLESEG